MAITLRAVGANATGTTSVAPAQPAGTATGDVLVAFILDHATSGSATPPTGWTLLTATASANGRFAAYVATVGLNGLTGTSWTWSGLTTRAQGIIIGYVGADATQPDVASTSRSNASGTTGTTSLTSISPGAKIVAGFAALAANSTWSAEAVATSPTLVEQSDTVNSTFCSIAIADGVQTTPGATGASSATMGTAGANAAILVALQPAVITEEDESGGFWSGVHNAARIATFTALSLASLSTKTAQFTVAIDQGDIASVPAFGTYNNYTSAINVNRPTLIVNRNTQDEVPILIPFTPEEDYRQNLAPPANAPPFNWFQQYSFDIEVQPQISFGLDEDGWDNPATPTTLAAYAWPQPFTWDEGADATVLLDEDGWDNPATPLPLGPPSYGLRLPLGDAEELPAATLAGQLDEDYWDNPVAPAIGILYQLLPLGDTDELAAGALRGIAEEDYWDNPASPNWGAAVAWPQPFTFYDGVDATAALDEDYWFNADAPAPFSFAGLPQFNFDADSVTPVATFGLDEDYLATPLLPNYFNAQNVPSPWTFGNAEDSPGGVAGQPDEDYWQNYTAPDPLVLTWPQPFNFEQNEVLPGVLIPDEDFWCNAVTPVNTVYNLQLPIEDFEELPAGSLKGQPDEDFWDNPIAPLLLTFSWPQQAAFEQNDLVPHTAAPPDEDFWNNAVNPVPAAFAWTQPFIWDVQEPGSLANAKPDEDYWLQLVAPKQLVLSWPQPFVFDVQEAVTPTFTPDEDNWQAAPPLAATAIQRVPAPWIFGYEDAPGGTSIQIDDTDYYYDPLSLILNPVAWPQPFAFEQNETVPFVPPPPIIEEEYWQNAVAPVSATYNWLQPWIFETQDLELTAFNLPMGITGAGTVFTYSGTGAVTSYAGKGKLQ